jgi:hypothetical protein
MPLVQKTIRANNEIELDKKANELIKDGWTLSSDIKCIINQNINYNGSSSNKEIWYQVLTKYID